ncbi:MAG: MGH1-like glycoside hydrolase domain-containing protein [Candidatus Helarchaeota archaeon]
MWNTWSFQGNTRFIHNTLYFEFIIGILNRSKNKIWTNFNYGTGVPEGFQADSKNFGKVNADISKSNPKNLGAIERYGPHEINMKYMNLIIRGKSNKYLIEASASEKQIYIKISGLEITENKERIICVSKGIWGKKIGINSIGFDSFSAKLIQNNVQCVFSKKPLKIFTFDDKKNYIKGLKSKKSLENFGKEYLFSEFDNKLPLYFAIEVGKPKISKLKEILFRIPKIIQNQKKLYETQCFKLIQKGKETGNAIIRAITWNIIWNENKKIRSIPVTKSWVDLFYNLIFNLVNDLKFLKIAISLFIPSVRHKNDSLVFTWDKSFNALIMSLEDIEFAKEIILNLIKINFDQSTGRMNHVNILGQNLDCSNPPVTPFCAWKVYLKCKDKDFLEKVYKPFKKWLYWFLRERDRNKDELFEWGCYDPIQIGPIKLKLELISALDRAAFESGWDNGVQWFNNVRFSKKYHCMEMNCIDLCSLIANSSWILSLMAQELGKDVESKIFISYYKKLRKIINTRLFDEKEQIYKNRDWNGKFQPYLTAINFYPLIAKIPSSERAQRIIKQHLYNNNEFWGPYIIPTVAKNNPYYEKDGDYWKGNIWPPVNYIIHLGLTNYDNKSSYRIAEKSMKLFVNEWMKEGHIHELLNSSTGLGKSDINKNFRSCPFYTWGALMGLVFVEEFFDVELDGNGIRFGNFNNKDEIIVENIPYLGAKYKIKSNSNETIVWRNEKIFFEATPGVIIRHFNKKNDSLKFECYSRNGSKINLKDIEPKKVQKLMIDENEQVVEGISETGISLSLNNEKNIVKIEFRQ